MSPERISVGLLVSLSKVPSKQACCYWAENVSLKLRFNDGQDVYCEIVGREDHSVKVIDAKEGPCRNIMLVEGWWLVAAIM
jgi:hypothetical protein